MTTTECEVLARSRVVSGVLTPEEARLLVRYLENQWDEFVARLMPQAKEQGIDEYDMAARICDALRTQAGMPAYKNQIF